MNAIKKDAYYFSHDSNARNDIKLIKLRRNMGAEGYGLYWMIIESLREQGEYQLLLSSIQDLAFEYHVDQGKLASVIHEYDLFVIGDETFYSTRLKRSMEEYNLKKTKLSEAGKKGNLMRWDKQPEKEVVTTLSPSDPNPIALKERKEKKGNKEKENIMCETSSPELESSFNEFLIMRKSLKKPATPRAIELLMTKLNQLANGDTDLKIKIIEQSIVKSWQDFFPLSISNQEKSVKPKSKMQY